MPLESMKVFRVPIFGGPPRIGLLLFQPYRLINLIRARRCVYEARPFRSPFLKDQEFQVMAKTSKINKNEQRKKIVAKYAKKRLELKTAIRSIHTSAEDRIAA